MLSSALVKRSLRLQSVQAHGRGPQELMVGHVTLNFVDMPTLQMYIKYMCIAHYIAKVVAEEAKIGRNPRPNNCTHKAYTNKHTHKMNRRLRWPALGNGMVGLHMYMYVCLL